MARINCHALILYRGHSKEIAKRLQHLPRLHLQVTYLGGVSVRDRIVCGCEAAKRILSVIGFCRRVTSEGLKGQGLAIETGT